MGRRLDDEGPASAMIDGTERGEVDRNVIESILGSAAAWRLEERSLDQSDFFLSPRPIVDMISSSPALSVGYSVAFAGSSRMARSIVLVDGTGGMASASACAGSRSRLGRGGGGPRLARGEGWLL